MEFDIAIVCYDFNTVVIFHQKLESMRVQSQVESFQKTKK